MAKKRIHPRLRLRAREQKEIEHNVDKAVIEEEVKKQLDAYNLSEFKDVIHTLIDEVALHANVLESMSSAIISAAGVTSNPRVALDELLGNLILSFAPMNGGMDRSENDLNGLVDMWAEPMPHDEEGETIRDSNGRVYRATIASGAEEQTHPDSTNQQYRYSILSYNLPEPGQTLFPRENGEADTVVVTYEAMRYAAEIVPYICDRVENDHGGVLSYHTVYMMYVMLIVGISYHGDVNEAVDEALNCAAWDGGEHGYDAMYDGIREAEEIVRLSLSDNEIDEPGEDEEVLSALSEGTEDIDMEVEDMVSPPRVRPRRRRGRGR